MGEFISRLARFGLKENVGVQRTSRGKQLLWVDQKSTKKEENTRIYCLSKACEKSFSSILTCAAVYPGWHHHNAMHMYDMHVSQNPNSAFSGLCRATRFDLSPKTKNANLCNLQQ